MTSEPIRSICKFPAVQWLSPRRHLAAGQCLYIETHLFVSLVLYTLLTGPPKSFATEGCIRIGSFVLCLTERRQFWAECDGLPTISSSCAVLQIKLILCACMEAMSIVSTIVQAFSKAAFALARGRYCMKQEQSRECRDLKSPCIQSDRYTSRSAMQ